MSSLSWFLLIGEHNRSPWRLEICLILSYTPQIIPVSCYCFAMITGSAVQAKSEIEDDLASTDIVFTVSRGPGQPVYPARAILQAAGTLVLT